MKRFAILIAGIAMMSLSAVAEEHAAKPNALLERLKPLVGNWETTLRGQKVRTTFSMHAGGSALVEDLMPDSEAMVNVIHADGDNLLFTHYCGGGNQPRYRATKFEGNSIAFSFLDGTNIGEDYMSGVTLTLKDSDHLVETWKDMSHGKETTFAFEFTRVK